MNTATTTPPDVNFYNEGGDILVLGIGNYLMGDEGVGVQFINFADRSRFDGRVRFLDGGTGGFTLVPYIESYPNVIFIDATIDGNPAGTIRLLHPKFSDDFPPSLSGHNFGLKDMLNILTMFDKMPRVHLFTISIDKMTPMYLELSAPVRAALTPLQEQVLALIARLRAREINPS